MRRSWISFALARAATVALLWVWCCASCNTKGKIEARAEIKNAKVEARVSDFQAGRLDLSAAHSGVSLVGFGPYGSFGVAIDEIVNAGKATKPALAASPGGEMIALAPDAGEPWVVFYLTPQRTALASTYQYSSGALASRKRTQPAGSTVDWSKVPDFLDVAGDMLRESHPSSALPEYQQDVLGEVQRRAGVTAVAQVLARTSDVVVVSTEYAFVHDEVCRGSSAWLRGYMTLLEPERGTVRTVVEKALSTSKLDAERVVRAALASPLDDKSLAPLLEARIKDLFDVDTSMADAARALLLRRLAALAPAAAGDVGCAFLDLFAKRTPGPHGEQKMVSSDRTEDAALLSVGHSKRFCAAVSGLPVTPADANAAASFDDEAAEPADVARKRVAGDCGVETRGTNEYRILAKAAQPKR